MRKFTFHFPNQFNLYSLLFIGLVFISMSLKAQTNEVKSLFTVLSELDDPRLTISTDLNLIMGDQKTEAEYPATVLVKDGKKELSSWDIKITHRGRFRRNICNFPPLKLDFSRGQLKERGLAKFDKFKLVTHCLEDKLVGNENVIREQVLYKLYNQVTPYSYRTLVIRVVYQDVNNPKNKIDRYAILIEPNSELEKRIEAKEEEGMMNPNRDKLDLAIENKVALFQYLIGNEDWSVQMMRNVKPFLSKASGKVILVPYDFDFSGMVKTSYAIPNADEGLSSIEERSFMGLATSPEIFKANKLAYQQIHKAMEGEIKNTKKLSFEGKLYMRSYLASFYKELETMEVPIYKEEGSPQEDK